MPNNIQTTHRDIAWFRQAYSLNQLEMKPAFQRNLVWTKKQKSFLMDSILNEFPVPELYMQDITNDDGSKKYIVVDGQQRITACLEYINNEFAIDSKDSPSFGDMTFDDLSSEQKKRIYSYTFVIRLLPEMSDIEIREIFSRLNRNNVILNSQELRQATYWGKFIKTMNEIADLDIWRVLGIFTSNDVKRMIDVEFISELTVASLHGEQNKKLTLDKYYEMYEDEFEEEFEVKYLFDIVTRELSRILPNLSKTRWSKKADFYSLFILFSKKKHLLPLSESKQESAKNTLTEIAALIDNYVSADKVEADVSNLSEWIIQYGFNLRASTDLGARKKRVDALEHLLKPIFEEE